MKVRGRRLLCKERKLNPNHGGNSNTQQADNDSRLKVRDKVMKMLERLRPFRFPLTLFVSGGFLLRARWPNLFS